MNLKNFAKYAVPVIGLSAIVLSCSPGSDYRIINSYGTQIGAYGSHQAIISDMAEKGASKPTLRKILIYPIDGKTEPLHIISSDFGADGIRERIEIRIKDGSVTCVEDNNALLAQCSHEDIEIAHGWLDTAERASGAPYAFKVHN